MAAPPSSQRCVGSVVTFAVLEAWVESPRIMQGTVAWMRGWPVVDIRFGICEVDWAKTATAQQKTANAPSFISEIPHTFFGRRGGLAEKWFGCGDALQNEVRVNGGSLCISSDMQ